MVTSWLKKLLELVLQDCLVMFLQRTRPVCFAKVALNTIYLFEFCHNLPEPFYDPYSMIFIQISWKSTGRCASLTWITWVTYVTCNMCPKWHDIWLATWNLKIWYAFPEWWFNFSSVSWEVWVIYIQKRWFLSNKKF